MNQYSEYILETNKIPIITKTDVLVIGGGPAGVAAAISARRLGLETIIVERKHCLGGTATLAGVTIWHTLYSADNQVKIIGGIVEEIIERLKNYDAIYNTQKDQRGNFVIDTEWLKLVLDESVMDARIKVFLNTYFSNVVKDKVDNIDLVIVENKSGRLGIKAKIYIDATGDGDLAFRAGIPTEKGDRFGLMQPPGLCFQVAGIAANIFEEELRSGKVNDVLNKVMPYNGQIYPCFLWVTRHKHRQDEYMLCGVRITGIDATSGKDITRAEIEGRQQLKWVFNTLRKELPSFANSSLVIIREVGVRESRRIAGEHILTEEEILEGIRFPDAIAQGSYPIDIHNPLGRGIIFKYLDGKIKEIKADGSIKEEVKLKHSNNKPLYYQIPYRSLISKHIKNLIVAGRCISATHEALGAIRVMVNCIQTGQAAGTAAALSIKKDICPVELDYKELHKELINQGMIIFKEEIE